MAPTTYADPHIAGELIEEARRRLGWTHADLIREVLRRRDLGSRYRFSEATLRNVERARVGTPSVRTQFAIATVLDLDVAHLWPAKR